MEDERGNHDLISLTVRLCAQRSSALRNVPVVDCERIDGNYVSPPFGWNQMHHVSERSGHPGVKFGGGRNGWKVRMSGELIDGEVVMVTEIDEERETVCTAPFSSW